MHNRFWFRNWGIAALRLCTCFLFSCILLLAFWIRVQCVGALPDEQFTGYDAYFYYWQAQLISEHGRLPERDMDRWVPIGRDLGQTLNLYGYVLAYTHEAVASVFRNVLLYHVTLYAPVVCFCIGLSVLCFFLYHTFGSLFATIVGVLLATLPGTIDRSTAGFSDRDAWCLMLGILVVTTYLMSLQARHPRSRLFWTLASGFTVFLGGLSWEGFGVFLSVILLVEFWRFLTSETEKGLGLYLIWVCTFVPTLFFASPAYQNGQFFATHLSAFMLVPPIVLLGVRVLRHLLITKFFLVRGLGTWVDKHLPQSPRTLALGLTFTSLAIAVGYVIMQLDTFASTTVPFSQSRVMQTVGELEAPHYNYWIIRYGSIFIVGSLGMVLTPSTLWKRQGILLSISLALFTFTTFFRQPLDRLWGAPLGNVFFGIAIACCAVGLLLTAWRRRTKGANEFAFIAFIAWSLLWIALSRDAKRYDFFIGVPLAFFTAMFLHLLAQTLSEKLYQTVYITDRFRQNFKDSTLKTVFATILLTVLMCLPINHAHTYRALRDVKEIRKAIPGTGPIAEAFLWLKKLRRKNSDIIVAAHWRYGSQLNVLSGVKTITDQDHYIQHWIHLFNIYVQFTVSERETLEFLKTHNATHLLLTKESIKKAILQKTPSDAFIPIYPKDDPAAKAEVTIWEIHYPPDIQPNPKYLATKPKE